MLSLPHGHRNYNLVFSLWFPYTHTPKFCGVDIAAKLLSIDSRGPRYSHIKLLWCSVDCASVRTKHGKIKAFELKNLPLDT